MIPRFVVCIPVFNNPTTIVAVIEGCLRESPHDVMVMDDGSEVSVESLYRKKHAQVDARLSFVRHAKNLGKGAALQTAFREAVRLGFTHLVAIDGDGQHDPADLVKMITAAELDPWGLIVGDRDMHTENVPGSSTFGKKFSNFWVRYQTNVGVADSQSGYRVYPLFFLQNMKFFCKRYDFEIEVLIRLIWKGVVVHNVKVSVKYFPKEMRVSHFKKWRDNFHITVANTFLTVVAMLREQTSPGRSSFAFAIGVFVGTTPIYGLHTAAIAALAFLLRLNFVYMFIGTQISIPPLVPFLVWGSEAIGSAVLRQDTHSAAAFGSAWIVGSLILGTILGIVGFVLMYMIKKQQGRKTNSRAWTGKNQNRAGIVFVRTIMKTFGLKFAYFFLYFIALYYVLFSLRTRRSFTEYWKTVRPQMGFTHRQLKMYQQVLIFAKTLVDRGYQRTHQGLVYEYDLDPSAEDFVKQLRTSDKGIVTIASHVGGWELAMTFFAKVPTGKKMLAVMRGIPGQFGHDSSKDRSKSDVIYFNLADNTILKLKDRLAQGQVIGMMGDRPVARSNEMRLFFGKLAVFDTTAIRIALACKCQIYFVFACKTGQTNYRVFTFAPPTGTAEQILGHYIQYLERVIDEYPEQWFNFFPFWSEAPRGL
ncbi:MAG: DUF2062 domain-containing protein [Bdellovibrionaceae bacterium]|nr:DUF2062 domain-containing protein [Pseudobdellovibrionaceae bacterium]